MATRGDTQVVKLSRSLSSIADAPPDRTVDLVPDLSIGGVDSPLSGAGDVATLPNADLAVLDPIAKQILVFDSTGRLRARIAEDGPGPGMLTRPEALVVVDSMIVVWEARPNRVLSVFNLRGEFLRSSAAPVPGDWVALAARGPALFETWRPTDRTRRLAAWGDTALLFQVQPDEVAALGRGTTIPEAVAHVVAFGVPAFEVLDTLWTGPAVPLEQGARLHPDQVATFEEPLYAPGPVWTAGDGWTAVGHGDSNRVDVFFAGGRRVVVRWPKESRDLRDDIRMAGAEWTVTYTLRVHTPAEIAAGLSDAELERAKSAHADRLRFADRHPAITAVYGAGDCLWVAGFNVRDNPTGTAATWVLIDVRDVKVAMVVRVPGRDRRVLHAHPDALFALRHDSLNVPHIERYPVSYGRC